MPGQERFRKNGRKWVIAPGLVASFLMALPLFGGPRVTVQEAASRLAQRCEPLPQPLARQFRALGAKALTPHHPVLAKKMTGPVVRSGAAGGRSSSLSDEAGAEAGAAILIKMYGLGEISSEADRARLLIDLAAQVRALPPGTPKLTLAQNLVWRAYNAVGQDELGLQALAAVADAFTLAVQLAPGAVQYLEVAGLVRYFHARLTIQDPAIDAGLALLDLIESLRQEAGFSLAALDGKRYALPELRGKVVLLNFWATWCASCVEELPTLERLYREYKKDGLIVLSVSDEKRELLERFLADKKYTFPILLDVNRKARTDFLVESLPDTIVFDRNGRLIPHANGARTEAQFRAMLKQAGLE